MVNLSTEKKDAIVNWWRAEPKTANGFLKRGRLKVLADIYHAAQRTLTGIIQEYKQLHPEGNVAPHHVSKQTGGRVGRQLQLTPIKRATMFGVAQEYLDDKIYCNDRRLRSGMQDRGHFHCLSTIQKWKKRMGGKKYSTYIKPCLSVAQKNARLVFCNSQKEDNQQHFQAPNNKVHVDESWYYLNRDASHELRFPGQQPGEPRRTQSKRYIPKVMVLAAVGYPHRRPDGTWFDGKIGIWACTKVVAAVNNSRNRPAGAPVTTPVNMNAAEYINMFTKAGGVRDKIREKLPHLRYSGIEVQQDGAKAHTGNNAVGQIDAALQQGNWNCRMLQQPPQSPDLNVLDLGLFNGMKRSADKIKGNGANIDTCVQRMTEAFHAYSSDSMSAVYVLFEIYRLTLASNGDNGYNLPHSGVRVRGRANGNWVNRNV